jgi:hypothetical protein
MEIAALLSAVYLVWRFLVRPLIRERTLKLDGMIVIAFGLMYFYDPIVNYFNYSFTYNAHFVNLGNWANYIPGWSSPNQHLLPEPLLFVGPAYVSWCFGSVLLGCFILRTVRQRFPRVSTVGAFAVLFAIFVTLDLIFEQLLMVRTGLWGYPGAPRLLTMWGGRQWQFPVWAALFTASMSLTWTATRWFKDDRGRSFVERGVEELGFSKRVRTLVSFLAVVGFLHLGTFVTYFFPFNAMALKADTWPAMPSYMRAGICGTGTDYACPSNEFVPVPSRTSLHVTPDDPRLPQEVRDRQGFK